MCRHKAYGGLRVPESVVPTESRAIFCCVCLNSQTLGEVAGAAARFRCVPLAAVLRDDMVEERAEDILVEARVGVVGVVGGSEVEFSFLLYDALQS